MRTPVHERASSTFRGGCRRHCTDASAARGDGANGSNAGADACSSAAHDGRQAVRIRGACEEVQRSSLRWSRGYCS